MVFDIVYAKDLAMVERERAAIVVDIRLERDYKKCHWPAAVNFPFEFTDSYEEVLDKSRYIIFYCEHGANSMQLARYMGRRGYQAATVIGGYEAIKKFDEKCLKK